MRFVISVVVFGLVVVVVVGFVAVWRLLLCLSLACFVRALVGKNMYRCTMKCFTPGSPRLAGWPVTTSLLEVLLLEGSLRTYILTYPNTTHTYDLYTDYTTRIETDH